MHSSFLLSLFLGAFFLACTLACIGLSVLYSHPRTHFKSRAGLDLMVNVLGIGVLIPLMGWSLSGMPVGDFPFLYLLPLGLALGSLYAPTTVADFDADHEAGIGSLAVTLGKNATMWLSVAFLLDMSYSTGDELPSGRRIIDVEREGMVLMAEALESIGDQWAVYGFSSNYRDKVDFYVVRDFDEPFGAAARMRQEI